MYSLIRTMTFLQKIGIRLYLKKKLIKTRHNKPVVCSSLFICCLLSARQYLLFHSKFNVEEFSFFFFSLSYHSFAFAIDGYAFEFLRLFYVYFIFYLSRLSKTCNNFKVCDDHPDEFTLKLEVYELT